jgi:formylglycine-generating enzyme required for sulfatase activity
MSSLNDFEDLEKLEIGWTKVSDAGMRAIPDLAPRLGVLALCRTTITDDGLRILSNAGKLHYLTLGPRITDRGLQYLKNCPLTYLRANECRITDVGLRQLESITTLRNLILGSRAKISESALQEFRKKLPDCKVDIPEASIVREYKLPPDAPPPAVAPFDAATAKQHQQAWAKCLDVPVEKEIQLPGGETLTMVLIPPGEFMMGSTEGDIARALNDLRNRRSPEPWWFKAMPSESPRHRVRITKPFYLGAHEVTVGQFGAFVDATGFKTEAERHGGGHGINKAAGKWEHSPEFTWNNPGYEQSNRSPVVIVTWYDAVAFCRWLSQQESRKYTLPTEAQWEYACRAGSTTKWHFGGDAKEIGRYAWCTRSGLSGPQPVGQKLPNAFGLFDMHGNVWEWCLDFYGNDYYGSSAMDDPSGPPSGESIVLRGGAFYQPPEVLRAAQRAGFPSFGHVIFGFRVTMTID